MIPAPRVISPDPTPKAPASRQGLVDSFRAAFAGLLYAAQTQRNMKIHLVSALLVGLVGSGIRLGLAEKVTLIFCVIMVVFAELLNVALESLVDLHSTKRSHFAKHTKDTAAAGVLVLAGGTVVIFAALVAHNWAEVTRSTAQVIRQFSVGIPLAGMAALLLGRSRPLWLTVSCLLGSGTLFGLTCTWSESYAFSALTGAVLILCMVCALPVSRQAASSSGSSPYPLK